MAEALLRHLTQGRADVHSAGTLPRPEVHPMATVALASKFNLGSGELFPKTLDRYVGEHWDYVITVCDRAAESCPVFPDAPERIHWSFPDPAAVEGTPEERQHAFDVTASDIAGRLRLWLELPVLARRLAR
jgi:arsenate reductase